MTTAAVSQLDTPELKRYRIMAIVTGCVLITACVMLIAQWTSHNHAVKDVTELIWLAHGWIYLAYVVVVFLLGLRLRWSPVRMVLVMAAGTIPAMSFVAEHLVVKKLRADEAAA